MARRLPALAAAVGAALAPAAALACPQCAARAAEGPIPAGALGAFLLLPFAIGAAAAWGLRRLG